ncbi:glycoside hydrolase family 28 protein [uncultured Prevotella sp.]|uniref:glycoside hydrolase family 28 protein n=1 Tax=uncultured Prevotella sp. TaxID=159272 RepID=UPI002804FD6B|nr:glycoside hydrolase family 28 protein [uncultured Prevotella sp.]
MKKLIVLAVVMVVGFASAIAADYGKYYQNLPVKMAQPLAPEISDYSVNIKDFGGVGDGLTLNTEAFAKAIKALDNKGGGHLVVPEGVWLTGLISLKDNIDLHLEKNAILMATPDRTQHFKVKDGVKDKKCSPLISASKRKNVSITGEGTIDGNGAMWRPVKRSKVSDVEWKEFTGMGGTETEGGKLWFPFNLKHFENLAATPEAQEAMRTHLIRFTDCDRVLVSGVTIQNSPKFHLIPTRCTNVIVDGVTIRCPWNAQNGDALDISCCREVLLVNNTIDAGDDGICMKGGAGKKAAPDGPCENILIQDNTVYHAHGGFVIGSEYSNGMKNIVARHNRFSGTDTGLRFKSGVGRGGKTEGIYISDIVMTDIKDEAIIFECSYADKKYSVKDDKGEVVVPKNAECVPEWSDIHISNVTCRGAKTAISAHGLPGYECLKNITIDNSTFFYTKKDKDIEAGAGVKLTNCRFASF